MKYLIRKYLAQNESTDIILADYNSENSVQPVLIKTVLPEIIDTIYDRLCSARELIHPGIQPIIDFGACGNSSSPKHYVTCKYAPGITLTQLLQKIACCKKNLPLPLILHIMNNLCDALEYLHHENSSNYIPHGNICPDNVFITFNGDILLIDTGIADLVTCRYDGVAIVSNQHTIFSHDDIIKGKEWKKRYEIHSLGLLLLCMLIGYNHFMGFYNQDDAHKLDSPSRFFPSIPADLNKIIVRAIGNKSFGRNSRYTNIQEFNSDLINFSCYQGIRFDKDIAAITIYALFFDSEEIPSQLRYLLQERIIDYCKNGNDNAIKMLLNNSLESMHHISDQNEVIFEIATAEPLFNRETPLQLHTASNRVIETDSILPPHLSVPYDLHLPHPETSTSHPDTGIISNYHPKRILQQKADEFSPHPIQAFSSIILDNSPELMKAIFPGNSHFAPDYRTDKEAIPVLDLEIPSKEDISFSAIRTKASSKEDKNDHPFSKLLLKEKNHT